MAEQQVEKIVSKINEDAEVEASKIVSEAESRAEELRKEAESKSKEVYSEIIERYRRDAEQERQRIVANAKLKGRKAKLDVREECIQAAFKRAKERLKELPSKEYRKVMENLILEAAQAIGESAVVLTRKEDASLVSGDFLEKVSEKAGAKIERGEEYIPAIGGVVVRSRDERVEVDNTFDTRLERYRDELRKEVAKVLFES